MTRLRLITTMAVRVPIQVRVDTLAHLDLKDPEAQKENPGSRDRKDSKVFPDHLDTFLLYL